MLYPIAPSRGTFNTLAVRKSRRPISAGTPRRQINRKRIEKKNKIFRIFQMFHTFSSALRIVFNYYGLTDFWRFNAHTHLHKVPCCRVYSLLNYVQRWTRYNVLKYSSNRSSERREFFSARKSNSINRSNVLCVAQGLRGYHIILHVVLCGLL